MLKRKIIIIISSLRKNGGAENVANYQSSLSKKYDISYITFYDDKPSFNPPCKIFCINETHSTNFLIHFVKIFTRAQFIKKISSQTNADILITHMEESSIPAIISKILFLNNVKIVPCIHNHIVSMYGKLYQFLLSILYLKADLIVGVSQNLLNDFLFYQTLQKKYITIYNAIDINNIHKKRRLYAIDVPKATEIIINVGRLCKQKDHITFIKTISNLPNNFHGIIIGDGPEKKHLEHFIKNQNMEKRIHLLGHKENIFPYLQKSTFFLFTSIFEGFGISIIEAMACGLPIISTNCKYGPMEILAPTKKTNEKLTSYSMEKYGILTLPYDSRSMANAIQHLNSNKALLEKYKKKSIKRAKHFNVDTILNQWVNILEKSLK